MGANLDRAKKTIRGLLGIKYDEPVEEIIPIIPERKTGDRSGIGDLWSNLVPHVKTKNDIYKRYSQLRKVHVIESLLEKVAIDLCQKGRVQGEDLIKITYEGNKDIEDIFNKIKDKFDIEKNIEEVMFEFLLYGEYILKNDFKNSQLDDRYDYNDILAVYTRGEVVKCFPIQYKKISQRDYFEEKVFDPVELFILSLPGSRIKLETFDKDGTRFYVQIPTPFISPYAIELINILLLLEKLIPLSQLVKLDKGQMLTAPVPPGTPINQIFDIVKEYEDRLNSRKDFSMDSLEIDDLLKFFGKYKVIPTLGEKGSSEVREMPSSQEMGYENFEYVIRALTSRLNVPINYIINGLGEDSPKATLLYFNKLKQIRENIAVSVKVFLIHYIEYRQQKEGSNISVDPKKLSVLLPQIPGTESLDSVDYMDSLSGTLSNIHRIVEDYSNLLKEPNKALDKKKLINLVNEKVAPLLGGSVFKYSAELDKDEETEEE